MGTYRLDSELEGLLREAAKDPDSGIFRSLPRVPVQRLALATGALRPSPMVHSALDRHLLETWRHELAALLFDAALQIYATGPGRTRIVMYNNPKEPLVLDSLEQSRGKVQASLERAGDAAVEPRSWLAEWLSGRRDPTVADLVTVSHRLVPNPRVVVLGALASTIEGQLRSAECALHAVLERHRDATTKERAYEALGVTYDQLGDPLSAIRCLRAAHELEPTRGHAIVNWYSCALVIGNEQEVLASSGELESSMTLRSGLLTQFESNLGTLSAQGAFSVSSASRDVARRLSSRLGPVGYRLFEVLMS